MADDLDQMARETSEYRREEEPRPPRLPARRVAFAVLVAVVVFTALAVAQGEPVLVGVLGGLLFASLSLGFESWRRRR